MMGLGTNTLCLWMPESPVDGKEAERAGMLLFWVLTLLAASHGVVGLAGLGARPGRGVVLCCGLVAMLPGPAQGLGHGGCREAGRC